MKIHMNQRLIVAAIAMVAAVVNPAIPFPTA